MYDFSKVVITSSPHIKSKEDTKSIMLDVLLALIPSLAVSTYVFGLRAILMTAVSIIACMVFEAIYDKIVGKENTVMDLSAAVTGVLLAFVCPVTLPYWMLIIGDGIAIIFAKCIFGGLGKNFINPALAGRAFLLASWPVAMTTWVAARSHVGLGSTADVVSTATPMAILKGSAEGDLPSAMSVFLGVTGGSMGEVSAIALLIGGIYLLVRKVITIQIPASYILTVAVLAVILANDNVSEDAVYNFTKSIFDGAEAQADAHAKYAELNLETASSITTVPYHAGAAKYYAEQDIEVATK